MKMLEDGQVMHIPQRTRRKRLIPTNLVFILLLVVLSACAQGETAEETGNGQMPPTENAGQREGETEGQNQSDADQSDADQSNADQSNETGTQPSEAEGTRTIDTAKGPVEIPAHPTRIVTDYYAGELFAVEGQVIGVEPSAFQHPFLQKQLVGVEDIGEPINVEKVLELQPDLIIIMYDTNYEALSKIAPTLHIPYGTTPNIYESLNLFGEIVGAPDKAEQFIARFDEKAAAAREQLEPVIAEDATFGLYELTDRGDLWLFGDNAGRGGQVIYEALQLQGPDKFDPKEATQKLSLEVLPDYAADYMFLTIYDPENTGEAISQLQQSQVWKGLDAVKNDQMFINDFDTFYRYDPIAIYEQIDLFMDMILEE